MVVGYRWSKDVEVMEMDGQWILMHAEAFTVTKLDGLGGFIWENLKELSSKEKIVERILEVFEVTKDQAEPDVDRFLNNLINLGLVECSNMKEFAI